MLESSIWLDRVPDQRRFPQLKGEVRADVAVIGGGIVGVLSAWRLAQKGKRVVLLEKNHIATGDTGATTGFLTRVPDVVLYEIASKYGIEFIQKLFAATREAQDELFEIIKRNCIACELSLCDSYYGSYESRSEILHKEWRVAQQVDAGAFLVDVNEKPHMPFAEAIRYEGEGKCNVRKFLFGLLNQSHLGDALRVHEESEAIAVDVEGVAIANTREGRVIARSIIAAVGDPRGLFPELEPLVDSKITYVMGVQYPHPPISENLHWDTLDPYFYYRAVDAHTIIIGGCDIDYRRTATQEPYQKLDAFLHMRLPGPFQVSHQWSGSIFHAADGLPYASEHPRYPGKVFIITGLGGNGLVMGSLASRVVSNLAAGIEDSAASLVSFSRTGVQCSAPVKMQAAEAVGKKFVPIGKVAEFKKPACKTIEGKQVAVFPVDGKFYALSNACSHAGGPLCDGTLEGSVIECPLHGAKFDVRTGEVKGLPAVLPQEVFATRLNGDTLEIEIGGSQDGPSTSSGTKLFPERSGEAPPKADQSLAEKGSRKKYWKQMFVFSACALLFWLLEFFYQYRVLIPGQLSGALVRGSALAGATLIGLALFSSAIFKWFPKTAKHWRIRRYLGVSGFVFIALHVLAVYKYFFDFDVKAVYYTFDPIENPIIFGSFAFFILFMLAATSTDWAVDKIGSKRWKFIHRFVYLAYVSSIFHFITINPQLLKNPAGYFLLAVTALALFGMLFWYVKTVAKRGWRIMGAWVGLALILGTAVLGYVIYRQKF